MMRYLFPGPVQVALYLAFGFLLTGLAVCYLRKARQGLTWKVVYDFKPAHLVQSLAQISVYVYSAFYIPAVVIRAPFIIYQLVFAYLFYVLFHLFKKNQIRLDASVLPIVLSINLFLWFRLSYFALHLLIIVAAILSKEYLVREKEPGRRAHIFNPSGLVMAAIALVVIPFDLDHIMRSSELINGYLRVPHLLVWTFVAGCFSQWAGGTAAIALGGFVALLATRALFDAWAGMFLSHYVIHPSVFIGLTLLVTDPATAPKGKWAQFVYGSVYGVSIVCFEFLLTFTGNKTYFDKLLAVPFLNWLAFRFERLRVSWEPRLTKSVLLASYAVLFAVTYPSILSMRTGSSLKRMNKKGLWPGEPVGRSHRGK